MAGIILVLAYGRSSQGHGPMDALFRVVNSGAINNRTKKSIISKAKRIDEAVTKVETASGIRYPAYYIEPVLTIVPSPEAGMEGLGILYARTIPVETEKKVSIVVQLSAPLVLYATKVILRTVLAHEFLHYVELVRQFIKMDVVSEITASSVFEEQFEDFSRAADPRAVFKEERLVRELLRRTSSGLDDPKLNEKCQTRWIEKGLPIQRLEMGRNQVSLSVEAIASSQFEQKVKELATRLD